MRRLVLPQPQGTRHHLQLPRPRQPCKHVAAVHYVLAQAFDADPFLLPLLRGRERDSLLTGLRSVRTGAAAVAAPTPAGFADGVPLSALSPSTLLDSPGGLLDIDVRPGPPGDAAAVLHRLGPPPATGAEAEELLAAAVRRCAERAWQLATGDAGSDPLLAELRLRGSATTQELSTALGLSAETVRAALRHLVTSGLAHRTGHARTTRYHA